MLVADNKSSAVDVISMHVLLILKIGQWVVLVSMHCDKALMSYTNELQNNLQQSQMMSKTVTVNCDC